MSEPTSPASAPDATPVAMEDGYFTIPSSAGELPHLIGSRCASCGEHFYPRRLTCAKCLTESTKEVLLSSHGVLFTHTYLLAPGFGENKGTGKGFGAGQIDLPEGVRVQSILLGERGSWQIGDEMEMVLVPLFQDKQGRDVMMYRFRKCATAGTSTTAKGA